METAYLRNRKTGERTSMQPGNYHGIAAYMYIFGWEPDPARSPDAPAGWRGTYPHLGSDSWTANHPGKFAIVNVDLQENGEYQRAGEDKPWQAIHPTGRCESFRTQAASMAHVLKIVDCKHIFDKRNKCVWCDCHSSDIAHYKQRMNP